MTETVVSVIKLMRGLLLI